MVVIFDTSYTFHKSFSTVHNYLEQEAGKSLSKTEALTPKENQSRLFRKVIMDFCYTLNQIGKHFKIDEVVFVYDSPSWRKEYYKEYKSKAPKNEIERLKQEENIIGNDIFHKIINRFSKYVKSIGFISSRCSDFEGDDMCYFWNRHYQKQLERVMIITGDKDILQIMSPTTAVYRNNSQSPKIFYTEDCVFRDELEELSKDINKCSTEVIDVEQHVLKKLLLGDSGDNVPNLFTGLGDKTATELIKKWNNETGYFDFSSQEFIEYFTYFISESNKKAGKIPFEELKGNLVRNLKLMYLHKSVYTEEQLIEVEEEIEKYKGDYCYTGEFNLSEILKQEE
jgi:5'-3' exonuclease